MSGQISLLDGDRFAPVADLLDVDSCQRKWQVEPGAVFTLDGRAQGHVLICGDSRSRAVAELAVRLVGRARRRLAVIDPPYGIKYRSSSKDRATSGTSPAAYVSRAARSATPRPSRSGSTAGRSST